jgi:hypothetical protein
MSDIYTEIVSCFECGDDFFATKEIVKAEEDRVKANPEAVHEFYCEDCK